MYAYFNETTSQQYSFFRIPKFLFSDKKFSEMSDSAKLLYGRMLDLVGLSRQNRWEDTQGRIFIYYTNIKIRDDFGCSDKKATKMLHELEIFGLIERKRQGLGKPSMIYVKNYFSGDGEKPVDKNRNNYDSGAAGTTIQGAKKVRPINKEFNKTDSINKNPFSSGAPLGNRQTETADTEIEDRTKGNEENRRTDKNEISFEDRMQYMRENLEMDALLQEFPERTGELEEIFDLIMDTITSRKRFMRISGESRSTETVKSVFMKLTKEHIVFVLNGLMANTSEVRCMKQYILASLYNAPLTINNSYSASVNHDLAHKTPTHYY